MTRFKEGFTMAEQNELAELHDIAAKELIQLIELVLHAGPDDDHAKLVAARRYVSAISNYTLTRTEHDDASRHDPRGLLWAQTNLKAANGEIIAAGQRYETKVAAGKGIESV
jgi:hypothetical protein